MSFKIKKSKKTFSNEYNTIFLQSNLFSYVKDIFKTSNMINIFIFAKNINLFIHIIMYYRIIIWKVF